MFKRTFLLPLLFAGQFIFAQKSVSNLRYIWTEHFESPKKTDVKVKYWFNYNWNAEAGIFVADKTNDKDKIYPRHIIDANKNFLVVQMEKRNEYLLEEPDSFFNHNLKLEPIEETKVIKGFKCRGYTFTNEVKLTGIPIAPKGIKEEYSLWVTDELQFNDAFNPVILALLRTQSAQGGSFNGVLVEFDYKMIYGDRTWNNIIELDTSRLNQKPETITWPWNMPGAVAWLEIPQLVGRNTIILHPGWETNAGRVSIFRKGDGSTQKMNNRLKTLLKKFTGQENPNTKWELFQNIFGVGPWGN